VRDTSDLVLDHGGVRLIVLAHLREHPSPRAEIVATVERLVAGADCYAPSIDRAVAMLEVLGYVQASGDPLVLAPTDDGLALLASGRALADHLIVRLTGHPETRARHTTRRRRAWSRFLHLRTGARAQA
jgi:hypothetical protein